MIPPFSFNLNSLITNTYHISKSASSDAASNAYSWVKPPGTGMVYIFILAPGGDGYSVPSGTNEGGGGGSGGRYFTIITPAMFIPDALKIQGPTASNNFVRILDPESGFVIAAVGAGGDSTGISGGTATVGTSAAVPGLFRGDGGSAGVSGGASGLPGTDFFIGNTLGSGGAGGGGTNAAGTSAASGGAVYVSSVVDVYPYPNLVSAAAGTAGSNGYTFLSPLAVVTPGAGGGGGLIRGGDGGNGGLGQGGGGGGGNTTGQGPSRGGKGGPGLVIIYSW